MNIEKRLKDIQNKLEDYFTDSDGLKEYIVVCRKVENFYAGDEEGGINCLGLIFIDEDSICINFRTKNINFETITDEEILTQLINDIYENEINYRNNVIRNWKSFSLQKIKSLSLHMNRGNQEKVQAINLDLVERYKLVDTYKKEVEYFKRFVRSLYFIKNNNLAEGEQV